MPKAMRKTLRKTSLLLGISLLMLAGCGGGPKTEVPADAVIELTDAFSADFTLVGTDGAAVADEDFRGRVAVVYFGFATCPDVCPLALSTLTAALDLLTEKQQSALAPIFITVDPERDTPEALKSYLAFDPRIVGLSGDSAAAERARGNFKVYARRQPLPDSALGYTMDHTSLFYIVDRDGTPKLAVRDSLTPAQLAEILRRNIKA